MTFKFNVGDVVINFESLSLWDNPYHFAKTLGYFKKAVVVAADDKCFTTHAGVELKERWGFDWEAKRKLCYQESGRGFESSQAYVNWTTNAPRIREYLQGLFDERLAKCDKEDADEIAKLEAEIQAKQARIEKIKAGKRGVSYKDDLVERDFVNERIAALNAILES